MVTVDDLPRYCDACGLNHPDTDKESRDGK
jgi:hypothetical protein